MKSNYELIRRMVIKSLEDNSVLDMEDEAYRWFSKTYHTPLMEAYKLPAELVVFYKWKEDLTGIDRAQLEELKDKHCQFNWNVVTQDDAGVLQDDSEMDDEAWIAEEEAKIKAQQEQANMTDADIVKRAEEAIRGLTSKLTMFKEPQIDKEERED